MSLSQFFNFVVLTSSTTEQSTSNMTSAFMNIGLIVVFGVFAYFVIFRPQKKREQAEAELRKSIEIGDEIVTKDGIVGIVVRKSDDTLIIETGNERTKIRIKTWAVLENSTLLEQKNKEKAQEQAKKMKKPE